MPVGPGAVTSRTPDVCKKDTTQSRRTQLVSVVPQELDIVCLNYARLTTKHAQVCTWDLSVVGTSNAAEAIMPAAGPCVDGSELSRDWARCRAGRCTEGRRMRAHLHRDGLRCATRPPEFARALDYMRKGDVLVVWKLDRLARSIKQLIETIELLDGEGIGFQSVTEAMDTTTPGGRLLFHICGALAELERGIIRELTAAGLAAARAQGRTGGAKRKLDEVAKREAGSACPPCNSGEHGEERRREIRRFGRHALSGNSKSSQGEPLRRLDTCPVLVRPTPSTGGPPSCMARTCAQSNLVPPAPASPYST